MTRIVRPQGAQGTGRAQNARAARKPKPHLATARGIVHAAALNNGGKKASHQTEITLKDYVDKELKSHPYVDIKDTAHRIVDEIKTPTDDVIRHNDLDALLLLRLAKVFDMSHDKIIDSLGLYEDLAWHLTDTFAEGTPEREFVDTVISTPKMNFETRTKILVAALGYDNSRQGIEMLLDLMLDDELEPMTLELDTHIMDITSTLLASKFSHPNDFKAHSRMHLAVNIKALAQKTKEDVAYLDAIAQSLDQLKISRDRKAKMRGILQSSLTIDQKVKVLKLAAPDHEQSGIYRRFNDALIQGFLEIAPDDKPQSLIDPWISPKDIDHLIDVTAAAQGDVDALAEAVEFYEWFLTRDGQVKRKFNSQYTAFENTLRRTGVAEELGGQFSDLTHEDKHNLYLFFHFFDPNRFNGNYENVATGFSLASKIKTVADLKSFLKEFRAKINQTDAETIRGAHQDPTILAWADRMMLIEN